MEGIVLQLLHDDVAVRGRGFVKLTEAYKKPNSMSDLFKILHSSSNPKVRQYAAVLLKKRLVNAKHWFRLPQIARTDYKAIILKQLLIEEVSLRSSIVDLTIIIANHELTNPVTDWPELFESIYRLLNGESSSDIEVGISLLPTVATNRPETLMNHVELIVSFLTKTLHSLQELNNTIVYNILLTILHLAPIVTDDQNIKNAFHETMPQVICSIQALTEFDKDQAIEVLELLDGLCKNSPEVTSIHTAILVTTCICIAENKLLDDLLRVKGLRIIKWLVDTKNTTIRNNELVTPIIDMIYTVMSEPVHNELGDFYINAFTNDETPMTCAIQILDIFSQHLSSQELMLEVLQRTELLFEDPDIYVKRGCYVVMAVVVEYSSKFIDKECSDKFLKYIRQSFTDSGPIIRNVVQFTLARFAKYIQIKTSEYAAELMPILCEYLNNSQSEIQDKDLPTIDTLFYMLDAFCESFADQIVPYLSRLMDYLFGILESDTSNHVKILALKSFSSATNGAQKEMLSYLPRLIIILKSWVTEEQISETADLKAQIFDTLSSIGRKIDWTEIAPVVAIFLEIGVQIVQISSDPILKRAVYNYFAEMSRTAPTLVAEIVSQVFDQMIKSVQIAERSKLCFEDVRNEDILLYQELDNDTFDAEDNDDNIARPSKAENSYIEEKKGAIVALGVLAVNLGETFHPYLETSYREVFKRINYPETSISQSSLYTLSQFFEAFSKAQSIDSKEMMHTSADILIPILLRLIYETNESSILEAAVITYSSILEFAKSKVPFQRGHKDDTRKCIIDIIAGNTKCQNLKETTTERDIYVKQYTGAMLANFQRAIRSSSEESLSVFEQILPSLLSYGEEGSIKREKSFGIEIISQSIQGLGNAVSKFAPRLIPHFLESVADPDTDLRCKASTAIARITSYGGEALYPYYPDMLQSLWTVFQTEMDNVTRDNLNSVINAIFGGILTLCKDRHAVIHDHLQSLMKISVNILDTEGPLDHKESKEFAIEFLGIVRLDYANIWDDMGSFLSPGEVIFVQTLNIAEPTDVGIFV